MKKRKNRTSVYDDKNRQNEKFINLSSNQPFDGYLNNLKKFYSKDKEAMSFSFNFLNLLSTTYLQDRKLISENLIRINGLIKEFSLRYAKNIDWFNNKSVGLLYWLRHIDYEANINIDSIVKTVNKKIVNGWFSWFALSQSTFWLQNLHDFESVTDYLNILNSIIKNWKITATDFSNDIILLVRALSVTWLKVPSNLQKIYESWKWKFEWTLQSPAEEYFFNSLKWKWVDFDSNIFFDWIEMDFFIKNKNLNIEIDWKHHSKIEKKISDDQRDKYLLTKWIKTIRIKNSEWLNDVLNSNLF